MTRQYTSFLLRCWRLDGVEQRYKIEHVQSSELIQVATLADALTWIDGYWHEARADVAVGYPDCAPVMEDQVSLRNHHKTS